MIAANNTVTWSHPLLFNFIRWHWLGTTHPCNPPHYGLWVNLRFFTICIYKLFFCPCYLFLQWNVVLKCPALCLITITDARIPHLYACLTCSSINASSLHPLLAHHHLCYVDVYCVLFYFIFFLFLWYVTSLCDFIAFSFYGLSLLELITFVLYVIIFCSLLHYICVFFVVYFFLPKLSRGIYLFSRLSFLTCQCLSFVNFDTFWIYTLKDSFLGIFDFKNGFPDLKKTFVPIFMHSAALVFMWQPISKKRGENLPLVAKISHRNNSRAFKQFRKFFFNLNHFLYSKKKYK